MSKRAFARLLAAGCLFLGISCSGQSPVRVGTISGGDFRLRGQVEFGPDGKAVLISGAQLEVPSGMARLAFAGGEARLCGPLKMAVLKSASLAAEHGDTEDLPLLFALDSGTLEIDYTSASAHAVQTPYFGISTVPSGKQERRLAIRVAASGESCIAAVAGSLRVREQVGPAEMMIPPGHAVRIPVAGVEKAEAAGLGECGCAPSAPAAPVVVSTAAPAPKPAADPAPQTKTTIATAPLVYSAEDAAAQPKTPKEAPKEAVVTLPVVRTAPPPERPADAQQPPAAAQPVPAATNAPPRRSSSFGARIKGFFRALLGIPKKGAGD